MGLNVVRLRGEMFFKGLTEKDFDEEIVKRINSETMPLSMLLGVAEKLETTTEYLMGYGDVERRNNLHDTNINGKIVKKRLMDLGWSIGMAQHVVSDKENQLRYITYARKPVAQAGYEISNLCWILDCSLEYITGVSSKIGNPPLKLLRIPGSTFKLDSKALKDICENKYGKDYVKVFAKKVRVSLKYARYLMEGDPYILPEIIDKIAHKLQFESIEVFRYASTETNSEENKTTQQKEFLKVSEIRHKREHNVPELNLTEGLSAESNEYDNHVRLVKTTKENGYATKKIEYSPKHLAIKPAITTYSVAEVEGKYEAALSLITTALSNPRMLNIMLRINKLDMDYANSAIDILENAVSVFEKRMIDDGRNDG